MLGVAAELAVVVVDVVDEDDIVVEGVEALVLFADEAVC
jgi:hypothetical protein